LFVLKLFKLGHSPNFCFFWRHEGARVRLQLVSFNISLVDKVSGGRLREILLVRRLREQFFVQVDESRVVFAAIVATGKSWRLVLRRFYIFCISLTVLFLTEGALGCETRRTQWLLLFRSVTCTEAGNLNGEGVEAHLAAARAQHGWVTLLAQKLHARVFVLLLELLRATLQLDLEA